jgi:hypothetical protein
MRRRLVYGLPWFFCAAVCVGAQATSYRAVQATEVYFELGTVALAAASREAIGQLVETAGKVDGCIVYAVVWAVADATEGVPNQRRALAQQRAQYVERLLQTYGVSPIHVDVPPVGAMKICGKAVNTCAQIEIDVFRRGAPTCP